MHVKPRQERVNTADSRRRRHFAGVMNMEAGLLIAGVIAVAVYLLVALILPERF